MSSSAGFVITTEVCCRNVSVNLESSSIMIVRMTLLFSWQSTDENINLFSAEVKINAEVPASWWVTELTLVHTGCDHKFILISARKIT